MQRAAKWISKKPHCQPQSLRRCKADNATDADNGGVAAYAKVPLELTTTAAVTRTARWRGRRRRRTTGEAKCLILVMERATSGKAAACRHGWGHGSASRNKSAARSKKLPRVEGATVPASAADLATILQQKTSAMCSLRAASKLLQLLHAAS